MSVGKYKNSVTKLTCCLMLFLLLSLMIHKTCNASHMVRTFSQNYLMPRKLKKHVLFIHPKSIPIMQNFIVSLKRLKQYQLLTWSQPKSLVLEHPELLIPLLRERTYTHWKALGEAICPGNVRLVYEEANYICVSVTGNHLYKSLVFF